MTDQPTPRRRRSSAPPPESMQPSAGYGFQLPPEMRIPPENSTPVPHTPRRTASRPEAPSDNPAGSPIRPAPPTEDWRQHPVERPAPPKAREMQAAPEQAETPPVKTPKLLIILAVIAVLLCGGLYLGGRVMTTWLTRQEEARQAAHQRLLDAHPLQYREWIERYAAENNLQPAFVAAIILNESSYNPKAESNVGARGLMQVMEDTGSWIADRLNERNYTFYQLWDPETNIRFGCWYLGYLSRMFGGDPVSVCSAYHAGQGTISRWLQNSEYSEDGRTLSVDRLPDGPTKVYAGRVTKAYAVYDKIYWNSFNPPDPVPAASADAAVCAASR